MLQQEVKLNSGNRIQSFLLHLKSSPDTSPARSGKRDKKSELSGNASLLFLYLSSLPDRCHGTRHSWMNLPQEVTCPRAGPTGLPSTGVGGRRARGPPGEADPGPEPAASGRGPASPRRRFPGAPLSGGGAGALPRDARLRPGSAASPAPGAGPGGAAAHGCGGSAAGGILTVTVGSGAGVVPASVPSLIQRAVAAWARRSGFNNVGIKYLCGIVLESQVASREDASQEKAIEVNGREKHGWFRLCLTELDEIFSFCFFCVTEIALEGFLYIFREVWHSFRCKVVDSFRMKTHKRGGVPT